MAIFNIKGVELKGLAAAVPSNEVSNLDYPFLEQKEKEMIVKSVGINSRRIANNDTTASDLCFAAADALLQKMGWGRDDISMLVFVSQTPDYLTPCTAAILQDQLELTKKCLAFDINLGCSGFPYGLATVASILQSIPHGKGLLLIGDKSSQMVSPKDKSTALLFSDAGSVAALEHTGREVTMSFDLNTDGSGWQSLMIQDGGSRNPVTPNSFEQKKITEGIERSSLNLQMNGIDIFNFAAKQVLPSIHNLLNNNDLQAADIDYFFSHQANKIINEHLRKMLKIEKEKTPSILQLYGNAGAASIPLTMVATSSEPLSQGTHRLLLSGFGVGLSWGNAILEVENLTCLPVLEI